MHIEHLALWTTDLERCKRFYVEYFEAVASPHYVNASKGFESFFLSFDGGARIEVMRTTSLKPVETPRGAQRMGLTHFAMSVGTEDGVDALTQKLLSDGFAVLERPRRTGDGYYESVVLDPDGNRIEVTADKR